MLDIALSALAFTFLISPILLLARAIANRSWMAMWAAAIGALVTGWVGMLSVGPLAFLLFCLLIPETVAMRRNASRRKWVTFLLLGLLVWLLAVPLPIVAANRWGWSFPVWVVLSPVLGILGLLLPFMPVSKVQARPV